MLKSVLIDEVMGVFIKKPKRPSLCIRCRYRFYGRAGQVFNKRALKGLIDELQGSL